MPTHPHRSTTARAIRACRYFVHAAIASAALATHTHAQPLATVADTLASRGFAGVIIATDSTGARTSISRGLAIRSPARAHRDTETWPVASVTKQVVAVLALMEVQRGTLTLNTMLGDALPAFRSTSARGVTIRQLLQHTSGLPNPDAGVPDDVVPAPYTRPVAHARAIDAANASCTGPRSDTTGTRFDYNNCDYLVLGAVLEARTGRSVATLIAERIARPLGLRSWRMAPPRRDPSPAVIGYRGTAPAPRVNLATFGAAGALLGTPDDLLRFDHALMAGRLLRAEWLRELWSGNPELGYAALGAWAFTAPLRGCAGEVRLVERRGDIGGVQVRNLMAPDRHQALVVFTNAGEFEFGEIWQGSGATFELASAAFCGASK